jgi:hypothetical protein
MASVAAAASTIRRIASSIREKPKSEQGQRDNTDQIVEFIQFTGKYWKIRWSLRSSLVHRITTV